MIRPLPLHDGYLQTLLEAHWAAQIPASASQHIEAVPDWSHTNLLLEEGILRGRPLPDGRRAEIDLATLTVRVGEAEYSLPGRTFGSGIDWLSEVLDEQTAPLSHELPAREADKPFRLNGAETQLQQWFIIAQNVLSGIAASTGGGEVRVWPHHFDIATFIEIDEGGGDDARSINFGLSPGDRSYSEPYWYVTPWPRPTGTLPPLTMGSWHTEGFTAAVFPASQQDPERVDADATRFLRDGIDACCRILE